MTSSRGVAPYGNPDFQLAQKCLSRREGKKTVKSIAPILGFIALLVFAGPARSDDGVEQRLKALQRQSDALQRQTEALQRQNRALQREIEELRARLRPLPSSQDVARKDNNTRGPPSQRRTLSFGGQYRINSYTADDGSANDRQTASRVRIRQNIDIQFSEQFKTHLQFELGHTTDNISTTANSSRRTNVAVRHAVLDYTFDNKNALFDGMNFQAGIVPLSDHFGDTLFSSDWNYNPVAVSITVPVGAGSLRAFAANLAEGDEAIAEDDFVHYQLDYTLPLAAGNQLDLAATLINLADPTGKDRLYGSAAIGIGLWLADGVRMRAFVMGSITEKELLGLSKDARGVAASVELLMENGLGLLLTHTTGSADGGGFLVPMALAATNGYWGYTGLLTVQGPTDTGFDGDAVNVSNNGFGMTTVQVKYATPLSSKLGLYLAAGWFGNSDVPKARNSLVGFDFLAMGTFRFNQILALDFGVAYARLEDSVSGYANGVIGGAIFNRRVGKDRNKTAFFSRLQAEF